MLNKVALGIIIGILFVSLVVLFCALLIKLYIHKVSNYNKLIYQKDIDFQKALTATVIETQEHVLNNISQDLHDDAGQQITAINFQLESLRLDSEKSRSELEPLAQSVKQLSDSIRSISHALNHQVLAGADLIGAICTEATRLQKNAHIPISCEVVSDAPRSFSTNEKIMIYRIFQESMSNILRHAKPTAVSIRIVSSPFEMSIRDDGRGFDTDSGNGLGLKGMSTRAAMINYSLAVNSVPGDGTMISLTEKIS